jgi:hypothetical protein
MASSDIRNVSAGQDVKLLGDLKSPDHLAFTLMLRDDHWQLQYPTKVLVVDSKGDGMRLDLTRCHDLYPQSHNVSNKERRDYWDGDKVTVFGRVSVDDQGNKTLEVRRLYPNSTDPYALMPGWYQTLWLIPAVCLILLVQVLVIYGYRRRLHGIYLKGHPVDNRAVFDIGVGDKDVAWTDSPLLENEKKRSNILAVTSVTLISVISAASALEPWVWVDFPIPLVSGAVIAVFSVEFAFLYREMTHTTPVSLGISKKGLHLRYRPRKRLPEQIVSIQWSVMTGYTSNTWAGISHLKLHTDKRVEYAIVPKDFLKAIDKEYSRGKVPDPAAPLLPPPPQPAGR